MKYANDTEDSKHEMGNWYLVDFDGVLSEQIWPEPGFGPVIDGNIPKLLELYEAGKHIVIHTARPWGHYTDIRDWLNTHELPFDEIICGKPQGHRYIDDKALNSEEATWL